MFLLAEWKVQKPASFPANIRNFLTSGRSRWIRWVPATVRAITSWVSSRPTTRKRRSNSSAGGWRANQRSSCRLTISRIRTKHQFISRTSIFFSLCLSNVSIRIDKIVAAGRYEEITLGDVGTSDSKRKSNIPLPGRNSRFVAVVNAWRLAICLFLSLVVFQSAFVVAQALMDAPDLNALRWLQQRAQDLTGSH